MTIVSKSNQSPNKTRIAFNAALRLPFETLANQ